MDKFTLILFTLVAAVAGAAAHAQDGKPVWKPDAASKFEVGTQLRPWTIHDEGMDTILENIQSMAGVNNIYLIVVMHEEMRPFRAPKFPHNPSRDVSKPKIPGSHFVPI